MVPRLEVNEQQRKNINFVTSVVLYSKLAIAKSQPIWKVDETKTKVHYHNTLR